MNELFSFYLLGVKEKKTSTNGVFLYSTTFVRVNWVSVTELGKKESIKCVNQVFSFPGGMIFYVYSPQRLSFAFMILKIPSPQI